MAIRGRCEYRTGFLPGSVACLFALIATQAAAQSAPTSKPDAKSDELSEVVVTGQREHYRGDVPIEDMPLAIQVIDSATLQAVGAVRLNDALDLAAGVARQNTFGGVWDSFAIRGFAGDINVPSGFLVNGFNGARGFGGIRDTSAVEKIEVMKGPGSALYGRGEPGGTVAITTKKPQFTTQGGITLTGGSYSFKRFEGDYTGPLGDKVAVRINGAFEDSDSYRDTVQNTRKFASPSAVIKIGERSSLWYELEWSRQELPFDRGVPAVNGVLGLLPVSRYLGEPGDGPVVAKVLGHQMQFEHAFGNNWVLLVGGAHRKTNLNGFGQNPEFAAGRNRFFTDGRSLARQRRFTDYDTSDKVFRVEASGSIEAGSVTNHLLFGADSEEFELVRFQIRYRPPALNAGSTLATQNAIDIFSPVYGLAPTPTANVFNDTENQKSYGIYLTDQLDLGDRFKLRLGGRYDSFKQSIVNRIGAQPPKQDVKEFSPQAGVMFAQSDNLNWYAAYGEGFRPNSGFGANGLPFEPEKTKSYEVGLKFATGDQRFSGTVAVFKMDKTNVLTADPVNAGQSLAIGEARSKGIELEMTAAFTDTLRLNFSYAYTDAETAKAVNDPDFARPIPVGAPLLNIPKQNIGALLFKDFTLAGHKLTVGAGAKHFSERLGETGTTFFLPSYTLVRLQADYAFSDHFNVTGEVTNAFDDEYYPSSFAALWVMPGAPRQFQIRAKYHF